MLILFYVSRSESINLDPGCHALRHGTEREEKKRKETQSVTRALLPLSHECRLAPARNNGGNSAAELESERQQNGPPDTLAP
jgi:hypothetical protein